MTKSGVTRCMLPLALLASASACGATCTRHIIEASVVSGVSAERLRTVMMAESAGRPKVVSSAGAMGCMQLMPGTWRDLTLRYALDNDPFEPRANMLAGALYLAEMIGRYGWPKALAAYHAGPRRLNQFLHRGRPLPTATLAYLSVAGGQSNIETHPERLVASPIVDWRAAGLFVTISAAVHHPYPAAAQYEHAARP